MCWQIDDGMDNHDMCDCVRVDDEYSAFVIGECRQIDDDMDNHDMGDFACADDECSAFMTGESDRLFASVSVSACDLAEGMDNDDVCNFVCADDECSAFVIEESDCWFASVSASACDLAEVLPRSENSGVSADSCQFWNDLSGRLVWERCGDLPSIMCLLDCQSEEGSNSDNILLSICSACASAAIVSSTNSHSWLACRISVIIAVIVHQVVLASPDARVHPCRNMSEELAHGTFSLC